MNSKIKMLLVCFNSIIDERVITNHTECTCIVSRSSFTETYFIASRDRYYVRELGSISRNARKNEYINKTFFRFNKK